MANLVDISTQTSSTSNEVTLLATKDDLPKDKPSLFDTLLKTTMENLENKDDTLSKDKPQNSTNQTKNITTNQATSEKVVDSLINTEDSKNLEASIDLDVVENSDDEQILKSENKKSEDKPNSAKNTQLPNTKDTIEKKTVSSQNSLLDRLILEVKNNTIEKNEIINKLEVEPTKDIDFIEKLDESIDELNLNNKQKESQTSLETKKEIVILDNKVIETIEESIVVKDSNSSSVEIKNIVQTTKDTPELTNTLETQEEGRKDQNLSLMDRLIQENSQNKTETSNQTVVTIETQEEGKKDQSLSLMDRLIQANSQNKTDETTAKNQTQNQTALVDDFESSTNSKDTKMLSSNIFLADQKNVVNNQLLFNKNEAITILQNASSLQDIEHSAKILNLDASGVEVEQEVSKDDLENIKLDEKQTLERKAALNSILNEKDVRSIDIRNLITNSVEASKALLENTITIKEDTLIDLTPNLASSMQTKIIGAKQYLNTMMSDIARQMYENYKPPVTAFRINLNPLELGSISILMKQDKANGLTISMSSSSLSTLELLMENQNMLRNSLFKTFSESSTFNLDFSQGKDGSNESSSNRQNNKDKKDSDTEAILKLKEENRDVEEKNDYM